MLKGKDILNTAQFSLQELNLIMNTAADFERRVKNGEIIKNMEGQVVASLFFEPSTRTRLSFESAITFTFFPKIFASFNAFSVQAPVNI